MSRIAIIDTETTGLDSNILASVIEVGAVIVNMDTGATLASFESYVRPYVWAPWADEASGIHHITYAQVATAPRPREVAGDLSRWLAAHECRFVTSYNTAFDEVMLARMSFHAPRWGSCIQRRASEIMHAAGRLQPPGAATSAILIDGIAYRPASLKAACEFFGVDPVLPAHRALSDALTAAQVLLRIKSYASP